MSYAAYLTLTAISSSFANFESLLLQLSLYSLCNLQVYTHFNCNPTSILRLFQSSTKHPLLSISLLYPLPIILTQPNKGERAYATSTHIHPSTLPIITTRLLFHTLQSYGLHLHHHHSLITPVLQAIHLLFLYPSLPSHRLLSLSSLLSFNHPIQHSYCLLYAFLHPLQPITNLSSLSFQSFFSILNNYSLSISNSPRSRMHARNNKIIHTKLNLSPLSTPPFLISIILLTLQLSYSNPSILLLSLFQLHPILIFSFIPFLTEGVSYR